MNFTVYIHTNNSNGKVYVGMTGRDIKVRWGKNGVGYKQNKHFWNAICKYGWDGFTHEAYATDLTKEEAARLEQFLISFFDSTNPDHGYNISVGGEYGNIKYKTKEEKVEARRSFLRTYMKKRYQEEKLKKKSKTVEGFMELFKERLTHKKIKGDNNYA